MNPGDGNESLSNRYSTGLQNSGFLAGFLEIAFDAMVAYDARERITYWNPAAEQLFGWTAQEALGKTPVELFLALKTAEEKKKHKQRQARIERGETLRDEQNVFRKDGSSLCVQSVARANFDDEGKFGGFLAIYRETSAQELAERTQKEESLRARTEEIETLLEVSPVAIFVAHDPECTHITGNPAGYRLVELPEDVNISKSAPARERPTYRTFRNGVEVPAEDLPMQKAARLGAEISEDELELRFEDGSQKFIYAFAKPLFDAQGKVRGAVAAMLDITDRKKTEQQLEQSNQWFHRILVSIQDDFYVLDRDWKFVFTSRSFTSRIGKEPKDFVGNNIWEMFPKHLGTTLEENFRAAMEKREIRRFEIPGKYTNAWYRINVFPSEEGITVLGTDISERKRLEAETESMARFPRENPNPVLRVSQEGVVLFGNRASQELLEDWNCSIGTLLPDPWRKEVIEQFRLGMPGEVLLEHNRRIISLHLVPIVESQHLNIYGRDITEHKRIEEALRENERQLQLLNETLEQQVHEKTAEIRRLASDLVKAVQHERHRISHILHDDLQQRIYAMQMQLAFLHDEINKGEQTARQEVSDIEAQLAEALKITCHLSIDLSPPILRNEGLSHAINWLAVQMRQRYGLPIELQAEGPFAIADEALHVLLFNCVRELLFNVVKHAQANQAVVALQWLDTHLKIEVSDDGKGFQVNLLQQPGSENISEEHMQTGLGLSTIHHQLSLFGGHIEIQSEPGAGTRVVLIVPVTEAE